MKVLFQLTCQLCELAHATDLWMQAKIAINRLYRLPLQLKREFDDLTEEFSRRLDQRPPEPLASLSDVIRVAFRQRSNLKEQRLEEIADKRNEVFKKLKEFPSKLHELPLKFKNDLPQLEDMKQEHLWTRGNHAEPDRSSIDRILSGFMVKHLIPISRDCESIRGGIYGTESKSLDTLVELKHSLTELEKDMETLYKIIEEVGKALRLFGSSEKLSDDSVQPDFESQEDPSDPEQRAFRSEQADFSAQIIARIRAELELIKQTSPKTIANDEYENVMSELKLSTINFEFKRQKKAT